MEALIRQCIPVTGFEYVLFSWKILKIFAKEFYAQTIATFIFWEFEIHSNVIFVSVIAIIQHFKKKNRMK